MLNRSQILRAAAALALSAVVTLAVGCGPQTATVQGKVTVNGEPLKSGSVSFQSATGLVVDAPIQPDGTYTAANVPVGTAKVVISAMDPKFEEKMAELGGKGKPVGEAGGGAGRGKTPTAGGTGTDWAALYRLVDEKYNNYDTSGLTVNVVSPTTTYDMPATKTKGK
jgi:hypothetical protein